MFPHVEHKTYFPAQVGVNPCGFCGLEGCVIYLKVVGSKRTISCSCKYHYTSMVYGQATKTTKNAPCTNVPIHCSICPPTSSGDQPTIWKYNIAYHLAEYHNDRATLPQIPGELLIETFISSQEEQWMGIGKDVTDSWRERNEAPDSEGIEVIREELKRNRAASTISVDRRTVRRT